MIFALLFGAELYGIVGALVALPIAAIVRETVVYLRRHLVLRAVGHDVAARDRRGALGANTAVPSAADAARRATRTARPAAPSSRARKYRPVGEHGHSQRRGHRGRRP